MKFIISESRLNEVIKNYLDTKFESWHFSDIGDGEFTVYDREKPLIKYRITPRDERGYYIFLPSLVWGLADLFGIKPTDSIYPLIDWLNTTFETNADYSDWDYEMDEEYSEGDE